MNKIGGKYLDTFKENSLLRTKIRCKELLTLHAFFLLRCLYVLIQMFKKMRRNKGRIRDSQLNY